MTPDTTPTAVRTLLWSVRCLDARWQPAHLCPTFQPGAIIRMLGLWQKSTALVVTSNCKKTRSIDRVFYGLNNRYYQL